MKTLFIEARKRIELDAKNLNVLDKLPKRIGLLCTIQYIGIMNNVKNYLQQKGKNVFIENNGQILGCNIDNARKIFNKVDCFLFLGQGYFHTLNIAMLGKPVFTFDESHLLDKIDVKEVEKFKTRKKSALVKFLSADKIGIIVSTKKGQNNMDNALKAKKELEKKGKKAFIFICDNIDMKELENFDCQAWLNTACQALMMEPYVLNYEDLKL